jgi:hypothetical protein
MKKLSAENHIGDGKMPNYYWVFQYDQKYKRTKKNDGSTSIDIIKEDSGRDDNFLGQFASYQEALNCVNKKAYLPNITIEDRLTGQVFESICIACQECGQEEYETHEDIKYTKERIEAAGGTFI